MNKVSHWACMTGILTVLTHKMTSYGTAVQDDESQTLLFDQEPGEPSLAAAPTSPLLRRRALSVSSMVIEPNVKRIFFMLGAAALLPWNGATAPLLLCVDIPDISSSVHQRNAIFPLETARF